MDTTVTLGSEVVEAQSTELVPSQAEQVVSVEEPGEFPLDPEHETVVIAFIESAGSLSMAAAASGISTAEVRRIVVRPEVKARLRYLQSVLTEHHLISVGSHLLELANIRELAKVRGETKVALNAEIARGKAAGFYKEVDSGGKAPAVQINFVSAHDSRI